MPIVVDVKSKEDFAAWLAAKQEAARQAGMPATGKEPVATSEAPVAATIARTN